MTWACCALWLTVCGACGADSFCLGETLLLEGDYAAARETFLNLSQQETPFKDRAAYMSALSLYRAGLYEQAAREWADLTRRTDDEYAAQGRNTDAHGRRYACATGQTPERI